MSDDQSRAMEAWERRRLIELGKQTGLQAFFDAAKHLRTESSFHDWLLWERPRGKGRPARRDGELIMEMGALIARGEAADKTAAARKVAARIPARHRLESTVADLVRKYTAQPPDPADVALFGDVLDGGVAGPFVKRRATEGLMGRRIVDDTLDWLKRWRSERQRES